MVVLVVALAFGLVAAAQYGMALEQVRARLASPLRDEMTARHALDSAIWQRFMPHSARRHYLMALICGIVFIACIGILIWREGSGVVAVIFLGILLIAAVQTALRWMRYRAMTPQP